MPDDREQEIKGQMKWLQRESQRLLKQRDLVIGGYERLKRELEAIRAKKKNPSRSIDARQ